MPLKDKKKFRNGAAEKEKCRIKLNRPTYIGTSILDLRKFLTMITLKISMEIKPKCF